MVDAFVIFNEIIFTMDVTLDLPNRDTLLSVLKVSLIESALSVGNIMVMMFKMTSVWFSGDWSNEHR